VLLPAAGAQPVFIAHAAGWGGIDAVTLDALGAFADAFEKTPDRVRNVRFDLAQVFKDSATPEDRARMAGLIRRIGPDRFVAGSDWPFAGDLETYFATAYAGPELSPGDWAKTSR
jgi:hypothetical protein